MINDKEKTVVKGYEWAFPNDLSYETMISILLIIMGIVSVWGIEKLAANKTR